MLHFLSHLWERNSNSSSSDMSTELEETTEIRKVKSDDGEGAVENRIRGYGEGGMGKMWVLYLRSEERKGGA